MIGRFSRPGVYRELLQQEDFIRVVLAGIFALLSLLLDKGIYPTSAIKLALNLSEDTVATMAMGLALASVTINGLPIIWGGIKGLVQRKLNVDELVSLAIIACLVRGGISGGGFCQLCYDDGCFNRRSGKQFSTKVDSISYWYRTANSHSSC
jgi:Cd2+/Zn2+-exporting ATPase